MSIKDIKDQLSRNSNFIGDEIPDELRNEKYNVLIQLGRKLSNNDFSEDSNKEAILKKIKNDIKIKGEYSMNRTGKIRRITVTAASLALVLITLMQTTFAQELIVKVKNSISLRNITATQVEHPQKDMYPLPDELKGKIFDKNGNPLEVMPDAGEVYTADGEKIVDFSNGQVITAAEKAKIDQEGKLVVKDSDKLNEYTCFKVILPGYLPAGYKFDRAEFYKDNEGNVSRTKYIDLIFTNETTGNHFFMQQRFSDEETAYEFSTEDVIEKIKINDSDAVISEGNHGKGIDWEYNGVLYGLNGRGNVDKSELIKIAESIK
ncbi:MAG: hypothetical protein K0R50_1783 [Eubacterium sp.]|jgi:hypothetical protein|nr:hypothetical protein [Eubacterium sp.]